MVLSFLQQDAPGALCAAFDALDAMPIPAVFKAAGVVLFALAFVDAFVLPRSAR